MKFCIVLNTLGCRKSESESIIFAKRLIKEGNRLVDNLKEADAIIYHPCKLQASNINLMKYIENKKKIILICYRKSDFIEMENIEFISSEILHKSNLPSVVHKREAAFTEDRCFISEKEASFIHIGYGCIRKCFYCPIKKEKTKSRAIIDILKDLKRSRKKVFLLADDCASYFYKDKNLKELLVYLFRKFPKKQFILEYIYPSYLLKHKEFFIKNNKKILIDVLPIQSGSKKILKIMNRGDYDPQEILNISNHLSISASHFIFGYPTETMEDFIKTVNCLEKINTKEKKLILYHPYQGTINEKIYGQKKSKEIYEMRDYIINNLKKRKDVQIVNFAENHGFFISDKEFYFHYKNCRYF